ncbi:archaeal proteasome endopeptidase complex subunit beta [Methanosphaerula palustris]|uniref:Proteasome subunit beta n=1 Tax=Methanosphaerula palustris (strain ATCC BAA-1556 / DSM 19958 / E1-9c) TaxID=521011 RepID=PSB_METPE|nr:archaeal proteasome endopeptidase complex subunit beta [Methanosphaerula palustris]B8GG66.1 RecName: Full=Proteasome subunit beta; AltName: Full=20S proteasome beta subunit; AltName: Full=Proteasome core protein PsmB; Flags: Precursor [Methanosphaerula palustris E1-9c]ACL16140.1 Proteasome, beta-type subunit, conserved site [Methanosphaerula palustris E1-9c]
MSEAETLKGTTTIGIVFKDGIILATEKRATMGSMIASKRAKKVYQVADRIGMTTAGGVGDAQQLARIMSVECNLYQIRRGRSISVGASSTLLSNYLNQNRGYPYYVQLLVGGVDATGPSVYSVDAMGGATRESDIVATGSGSPMAYGVLEDRYKKDLTEDEAIELAIRALRAAMRRDSASGEGIHVVIITKDAYSELSEERLEQYTAAVTA